MKTKFSKIILGTAAAMLCIAASGAEVYTKYVHWTHQPTVHPGGNVRNQCDFTLPVHGPWLTNPKPDGMTVTWITRVPCAGGIEYREKGTEEFKQLWFVKGGMIDYTKDIHSFHLTGLKPGTEYEYRLLSNQDHYSTAYHMILSTGRELYSFHTIDPKKENYKVFLTCDFHGGSRLNLDPMYERTGAKDADFYWFLGDTVEDNVANIRYFTTFGYLDDVTRIWGKNKPSIFLRGNHDIWGRETYQYADYFPQPDGKTYQAFRQGSVLWIGLDTMWTAKEKLQQQQMERYWEEQAEWLRELKKTDLWKTAKFRVVSAHLSTFANEANFLQKHFDDVLNDSTPDGRIHLYLAGHMHCYYRINAGTKEVRANNQYGDVNQKQILKYLSRSPIPDNVPYTLVVGHLVEGMTIDVTKDKLTVRSHRWGKPEGGLYDAFEVYPDGTVKDIIDVEVLAVPEPKTKAKK